MLASCAVGLVRRDGSGGYRNSGIAEKVLTSGSPYSMLPFIQFNRRVQDRCSSHLTQALKENRNAGKSQRRFDEFPGSGNTTFPHRDIRRDGCRRPLRCVPTLSGYEGNDLCETHCGADCAPTRRGGRTQRRIECAEGDIFLDMWPTGCDAILFSHVVEIFSPERIRMLYKKALETLPLAKACCKTTNFEFARNFV
jgi:hypothetical protein